MNPDRILPSDDQLGLAADAVKQALAELDDAIGETDWKKRIVTLGHTLAAWSFEPPLKGTSFHATKHACDTPTGCEGFCRTLKVAQLAAALLIHIADFLDSDTWKTSTEGPTPEDTLSLGQVLEGVHPYLENIAINLGTTAIVNNRAAEIMAEQMAGIADQAAEMLQQEGTQ